MRGRGLVYGAGPDSPLPREAKIPGAWAINCAAQAHPLIDVCDRDLSMFKNEHADFVFVGPMTAPEQLGMLADKLRPNKHLIIHTNSVELQPQRGSWLQKTDITRDGQRLRIFKKLTRGHGIQIAPPAPSRRACVCRYGAIGDMVMVTPLLKRLKQDGYYVAVNTTPYSAPILENNPYIDNLLIQERNSIPNPELGAYWQEWQGDYEKYINLSESLEGSLLRIEQRMNYYIPQSQRRAECDINYLERTLALGGYTYDPRTDTPGELYLTANEQAYAESFRRKLAGRWLCLWGLNGSSAHKTYPLMETVLREWLSTHPDAVVATIGDPNAVAMEFDHPQVVRLAGRTSVREMCALASAADCVIGPESALVNIASAFKAHKIVLLSHSSKNNLTRDWANTVSLEPQDCACYPCHQLHYTREGCPLVEAVDSQTNIVLGTVPVCTLAIPPSAITSALSAAYTATS